MGPFALAFLRHYNSGMPVALTSPMGSRWTHTFSRRLDAEGGGPAKVRALRSDGEIIYFASCPTGYCGGTDQVARLNRTADINGNTTGWTLVDRDDVVETYDGGGRLLSETSRAGVAHTLTYTNTGRLFRVTDSFGHRLEFGYDASGRINSVKQPDSSTITYSYDAAGNLASVSYPDSTSRTYLYDETGYVAAGASRPRHLSTRGGSRNPEQKPSAQG